MNRQRTLATWLGIILGTLCALLLAAAQGYAVENQQLREEFHQTYPIAAGGEIRLSNINGPAHITAWDRDEVQVDAVKRADSQQALDRAKIRVDATPDLISIRTEYEKHDPAFDHSGWEHPASVEYTLMVPRKARLAKVDLINGPLDIQGVAGEVRASCINGSLTARDLRGETRLSTINSKLDAEFDQLGESSLEMSSVNGTVDLTVPSDAKATIQATTVNGKIENDFGLRVANHRFVGHDMRGELGGGGTRVRLSNVNGSVHLHHANDGHALSPVKDETRGEDDAEI